MRSLDPFFFQGGDPEFDAYMLFTFLDTPSNNLRHDNPDTYECQIMVSWPYREGLGGRAEPLEVPPTSQSRVSLMKSLAEGWAEPIQECVMAIPEGTEAQAIKTEDFWAQDRDVGLPARENLDGRGCGSRHGYLYVLFCPQHIYYRI